MKLAFVGLLLLLSQMALAASLEKRCELITYEDLVKHMAEGPFYRITSVVSVRLQNQELETVMSTIEFDDSAGCNKREAKSQCIALDDTSIGQFFTLTDCRVVPASN